MCVKLSSVFPVVFFFSPLCSRLMVRDRCLLLSIFFSNYMFFFQNFKYLICYLVEQSGNLSEYSYGSRFTPLACLSLLWTSQPLQQGGRKECVPPSLLIVAHEGGVSQWQEFVVLGWVGAHVAPQAWKSYLPLVGWVVMGLSVLRRSLHCILLVSYDILKTLLFMSVFFV